MENFIEKNKRCTGCNELKPRSDFYQKGSRLFARCKTCWLKQSSDYYYSKPEHLETERVKRRYIKRRETGLVALASKKYRDKHPAECKSRYVLKNAIRSGKILRQPCEICSKTPGEAHHWNYKLPLSVIWLCRSHHLFIHGNIRTKKIIPT